MTFLLDSSYWTVDSRIFANKFLVFNYLSNIKKEKIIYRYVTKNKKICAYFSNVHVVIELRLALLADPLFTNRPVGHPRYTA